MDRASATCSCSVLPYLMKDSGDETNGSMNMGFVTMSAMMLLNSVNENNLLPWQLINSSRARVKKPFVAINTAKCGSEDLR